LVEASLVQHDVEPVTIEKLRWLLGKAVVVFGNDQSELRSQEIAASRIALPPGYRFEATGAAAGARARGGLGHDRRQPGQGSGRPNPSPRRREQRPFESWAELDAVVADPRRDRPGVPGPAMKLDPLPSEGGGHDCASAANIDPPFAGVF